MVARNLVHVTEGTCVEYLRSDSLGATRGWASTMSQHPSFHYLRDVLTQLVFHNVRVLRRVVALPSNLVEPLLRTAARHIAGFLCQDAVDGRQS
jgi:hypothetical protein